ncbi:MAG: 2-oxoacid ferredoxin oxidoreductase [Deltaproteobacteria bacterium]|nr:MAG: 2-oxoacid ferredoxin oxidoreductase [Deltaproteobacteria bacterium]
MENVFDRKGPTAWCPGCGNHALRKIVLDALEQVGADRQKVVFVSGIGQAAKAPQYMNVHYFNGLHGRAIPAATGIKIANPELTVIVESGDGDLYGEGGNHLLHAIRRNPDITVIAHNNMVYGLTKGQASPTSPRGMVTSVQVTGVLSTPFNPLALAISQDASFVARGVVSAPELTRELIVQAISHRGFALVDVFQNCATYNKINTFKWYRENTVTVPPSHDPSDRLSAFSLALEENPYPIGLFYMNEKPTFERSLALFQRSPSPLHGRRTDVRSALESLAG